MPFGCRHQISYHRAMRAFLALVWTVLSLGAAAQDRTYAIVSLLGDHLTVVSAVDSTGSSLDHNARNVLKVGSPVLDQAAVLAVDTAVRRTVRGSNPVLLLVNDPKVYEAQSEALEAGGSAQSLLPTLAPTLAQAKATHLLLLTKVRREADLQIEHNNVGHGNLDGLGFYVDRSRQTYNRENGDRYVGFLAPYAYFRVSLVDLATGSVVSDEIVTASRVRGVHSEAHPWDSMTPEQKIGSLKSILRTEANRVVPQLLERAR